MNLDKTALLLIDLQNEEGTSEIDRLDQIVSNSAVVAKECREKGIPVIFTRHVNSASGVGLANREPRDERGKPVYYASDSDNIKIIDKLETLSTDIIIDKHRYSGFFESRLDLMLRSMDIKHLIIGGVLTDCCVLATVLDAYNRNYQVTLVNDMCGTTTEAAHMTSILTMVNWIYDLEIYETDEIIAKLNGKSSNGWKVTSPEEVPFNLENIETKYNQITKYNSEGRS